MGGVLKPLPFRVGGGPTLPEIIYTQLRNSLGPKGPGPKGGIEDTWRMCKAIAMAKGLVAVERAVMRVFPNRGGESLPVWEAILGLAEADTLGERIENVTVAYAARPSAVFRKLEAKLQAIEPTITLVVPDRDTTTVARYGKPFQTDTTLAGDTSHWPAYDEHAICFVKWPGGVPDQTKRARVERILNRDLPAFYDWRIFNASGFYCDGFNDSFCDLTLLG